MWVIKASQTSGEQEKLFLLDRLSDVTVASFQGLLFWVACSMQIKLEGNAWKILSDVNMYLGIARCIGQAISSVC